MYDSNAPTHERVGGFANPQYRVLPGFADQANTSFDENLIDFDGFSVHSSDRAPSVASAIHSTHSRHSGHHIPHVPAQVATSTIHVMPSVGFDTLGKITSSMDSVALREFHIRFAVLAQAQGLSAATRLAFLVQTLDTYWLDQFIRLPSAQQNEMGLFAYLEKAVKQPGENFEREIEWKKIARKTDESRRDFVARLHVFRTRAYPREIEMEHDKHVFARIMSDLPDRIRRKVEDRNTESVESLVTFLDSLTARQKSLRRWDEPGVTPTEGDYIGGPTTTPTTRPATTATKGATADATAVSAVAAAAMQAAAPSAGPERPWGPPPRERAAPRLPRQLPELAQTSNFASPPRFCVWHQAPGHDTAQCRDLAYARSNAVSFAPPAPVQIGNQPRYFTPGPRPYTARPAQQNFNCYRCGQPNHWANACPFRPVGYTPRVPTPTSRPRAPEATRYVVGGYHDQRAGTSRQVVAASAQVGTPPACTQVMSSNTAAVSGNAQEPSAPGRR